MNRVAFVNTIKNLLLQIVFVAFHWNLKIAIPIGSQHLS